MELDPALLTEFKTIRLHPLIQRRELMFGMALATSTQMPEAERSYDAAHAEILALARAQFAAALIEKGMQPDGAEQVVQHVENQNTQTSRLMLDLVGSFASLRRTSEQRELLPSHMRSAPSFVTQLRLEKNLQEFLGEQADNYALMIRVLAPGSYTNGNGGLIGELKRNDVILQFHGKNSVEQAECMKEVLNTLKKELSIEGLFAGLRKDEPSRGHIYGASVSVDPNVLKELVTAYAKDPKIFQDTLRSVQSAGRAIG